MELDINKLKDLDLNNVKIEKIGTWLWLSGATYKIKDNLRELGFFFSANKKAWFWNGQGHKTNKAFYKNLEELKLKWGVENVILN